KPVCYWVCLCRPDRSERLFLTRRFFARRIALWRDRSNTFPLVLAPFPLLSFSLASVRRGSFTTCFQEPFSCHRWPSSARPSLPSLFLFCYSLLSPLPTFRNRSTFPPAPFFPSASSTPFPPTTPPKTTPSKRALCRTFLSPVATRFPQAPPSPASSFPPLLLPMAPVAKLPSALTSSSFTIKPFRSSPLSAPWLPWLTFKRRSFPIRLASQALLRPGPIQRKLGEISDTEPAVT